MTPPLQQQPRRRPSANSSRQAQPTPSEGVPVTKKKKRRPPPQDTREEAPGADVARPSKRTVDEPTREPLQTSDENKAARPTPVQEERGSTSRVEETVEEQTLSPGYQVSENDDEFRNVWD